MSSFRWSIAELVRRIGDEAHLIFHVYGDQGVTVGAKPLSADPPREVGIVLLDMVFNMGWGDGLRGLSSFRAMLPAIHAGQYEYAARLLLRSKYARDTGDRAKANASLLERAASGAN